MLSNNTNLLPQFRKIMATIDQVNPSKCCHLPIGQPPTTPLTFADGTPVAMVDTAKDLGVAIDTSYKPSLQCREGFVLVSS